MWIASYFRFGHSASTRFLTEGLRDVGFSPNALKRRRRGLAICPNAGNHEAQRRLRSAELARKKLGAT